MSKFAIIEYIYMGDDSDLPENIDFLEVKNQWKAKEGEYAKYFHGVFDSIKEVQKYISQEWGNKLEPINIKKFRVSEGTLKAYKLP